MGRDQEGSYPGCHYAIQRLSILDQNCRLLINISPLTKEFVDHLCQWADVVRKSYDEGATDEIISTRRLVHIAIAFTILKDRVKAITLCVNRFDEETKMAFLDLYSKVDSSVESPANTSTISTTSEVANQPQV